MQDFKDKVAVITGGASGVGRSLAFSLGRRGAMVVVGDVDKTALEETLEALGAEGIAAVVQFCDVSSEDSLAELADTGYIDPFNVAIYYARAGDAEQTFVWLEKSIQDKSTALHMIAGPALDPYRQDPRFASVMRRMDMPEAGWRHVGSGGD